MLSAAEMTSAALAPVAQAQAEQVQLLAETSPEVGSAIQEAQTAAQWQVSLIEQVMTFEGNAVAQLLQPLMPGLGQNVDFRV
jgi:hypothetical protein